MACWQRLRYCYRWVWWTTRSLVQTTEGRGQKRGGERERRANDYWPKRRTTKSHVWRISFWCMRHVTDLEWSVTMLRHTNKWSTPNKHDKDPGKVPSLSITKSTETGHMKHVRSDISKKRHLSAKRSAPPEPGQESEHDTVIGHENAHARMSAFLAIISAIFTKLLEWNR